MLTSVTRNVAFNDSASAAAHHGAQETVNAIERKDVSDTNGVETWKLKRSDGIGKRRDG